MSDEDEMDSLLATSAEEAAACSYQPPTMEWKALLLKYWKSGVIIGAPIVLAPLPLVLRSREASCAYVVMLMAVYWMTEVIPLAVTAFLPLFLFPLLGVLGAKSVAINYLTDSNFVFVGSMMMALAVEESGLHERIALRILLFMGSNPRWLMLGFQLATAFLSMWMSNTATTAMMVPIALAVIQELAEFNEKQRQSGDRSKEDDIPMPPKGKRKKKGPKEEPVEWDIERMQQIPLTERKIYKALLLAICYSANIGGTGTLTGTGSNIVLSGQLTKLYPDQDSISFASWMAFAIPALLLCLFISWLWLQFIFIGFRRISANARISTLLKRKYRQLGPMRFQEGITLVMFVLLVGLWLFRDPKVFPGWSSIFIDGYVTDGATAMMVGCLLFVLPRNRPGFCGGGASDSAGGPLLNWPLMQRKFSWSIVMLLGGGYAMAAGVKESGLSDWMGKALSSLDLRPTSVFVFVSLTIVTFTTEFTSNVAAASIFIPLMNAVAVHLSVNPLYFILPVTIGCSFAFMLPVATPPNAIVFSAGLIKVVDMVMTGFMMNCLCIAVTMLNMETYAYWLFQLGTMPSWAGINATTTPITVNTTYLPH